mmetsp:Transcript_22709/g.27857  ORF Transcript_22709/g.27857 Transcript_22709/m.27857 type:complete len:283 (-) Transcript_22709:133-981(-)
MPKPPTHSSPILFQQPKQSFQLSRRIFFIIALFILFVPFNISIMVTNKNTNTTSTNHPVSTETPNNNNKSEDQYKIEYRLMEEVDGVHKRFAAFIQTKSQSDQPLSIIQWVECFKKDDVSATSIRKFTDLIKDSTSDYKAFFLETKGTSFQNAEKQFEFVLVNSIGLHDFCERNGPDSDTFEKHLNCPFTCCSFMNLSGDATLIVPKNLGLYSHLALFLRNAEDDEITNFWQLVALKYSNALSQSPSKSFWLSTSGMGVSWLHVRIDRRPKYYTFRQFAQET